MSQADVALEAARVARARAAASRPASLDGPPVSILALPTKHRVGERVFDKVTGNYGTVEAAAVRSFVLAARKP